MPSIAERVEDGLREARARVDTLVIGPRVREVGHIDTVGSGVVTISGLPSVRLDELLLLPRGIAALAVALDADRIGAVLLDPVEGVTSGGEVAGTGDVARVPVGEALLGRVVDPLGRPLDGGPPIIAAAARRDPIERPAPAIADRDLVTQSLHTGVLVVDAMIPVGRGQRELII